MFVDRKNRMCYGIGRIKKTERMEIMKHPVFKKSVLLVLCLLAALGLCGMAAAEETAPEQTRVEVFTVDEFLDAIASNTEIVLATGEYNLTKATGYSRSNSAYYHWEGGYDGYELVITDVENLSIVGGDPNAVTISTEPRYANVLRFDNVDGVTLSNLVVGHTREQGYCTGGVLYFDSSRNVEIQNCRLYGCGTTGAQLYSCKGVHVDGSEIYECSYGCIEVTGSENVLFENSKFRDCEVVMEGFAIHSSRNVAIINSEICRNNGGEFAALFASDSVGVYLGGLDIHDNFTATLFSSTSIPVTLDSCRVSITGKISDGKMPVAPDGTELSAADIKSMKMRAVTWEPTVYEDLPKPEAGEDGKIHVSTVDEFLAALDSDTTIFLEPGEYNLTAASNYGGLGGSCYSWENTYVDGYQLLIRGISNLTIEAESADTTSIVTDPRYANVLYFYGVDNLTLRNVKVGRTEEPGACSGGVVLEYCHGALIEGCKLFGCGTIGVDAIYCKDLTVNRCEIYECSASGITLWNCEVVRAFECDFHDIGEGESDYFYASEDSRNVSINGQVVR